MSYWLSRDSLGVCQDQIYLWGEEPSALYEFCADNFKQITGIYLKPGELRKIKSINIELEEK